MPAITFAPASCIASTARASLSRSKTAWVWKKRAPAATFSRVRASWTSHGSASGNIAAPRNRSVPPFSGRPSMSWPCVEPGCDLQQLRGVQVEDALGLRVVARARVVPSHDEQVLEPQRPGREQVGLERQPVPVAAGLLEDRLDTHVEHDARGRQAGEVQAGALVVGDVDRVAHRREHLDRAAHGVQVGSERRRDLARDDEAARVERVAQAAHDASPAPVAVFAPALARRRSSLPGFSFLE